MTRRLRRFFLVATIICAAGFVGLAEMRTVVVDKSHCGADGRLGFTLATSTDRGEVIFTNIVTGLPFHRAGMRIGDVILTLEGKAISSHDDAFQIITSGIRKVHFEVLDAIDVPVLPAELISEQAKHAEDLYEVGEVLGEGAFGVVRRGISKAAHLKASVPASAVAIKSITVGPGPLGHNVAKMRTDLRREVALLRRLSGHDGIVRLLDAFEAPPVVTLVLELCDGGDLRDVLALRGAIPEAETRHCMAQLAETLAFLHAHDVIHRDLKPDNVMIVHALPPTLDLSQSRLKLVDFGLARSLVRWRRSTRVTPLTEEPVRREGSGLAGSMRRSVQRLRSSVRGSLVAVQSATAMADGVAAADGVEAAEPEDSAPAGAGRRRGRAAGRLSVAGTAWYWAPELEAASAMGEVTIAGEGALLLDAYSLGRILEQMLLGTTPDGDGVQDASCCGRSACASPARRKPPSSRQSSSPAPSPGPIPFVARRDASTLSAAARELIGALMHPDPEKRMAVAAATRSPFFVGGGERV